MKRGSDRRRPASKRYYARCRRRLNVFTCISSKQLRLTHINLGGTSQGHLDTTSNLDVLELALAVQPVGSVETATPAPQLLRRVMSERDGVVAPVAG